MLTLKLTKGVITGLVEFFLKNFWKLSDLQGFLFDDNIF